ncbi:hypothetical protein LXA43DRAFT_59240 [Ganoderma leucocontextum]|nr:hypothetical protein LXA43DRAFT_59240 [Ganoderma leucocontextum]
MSTASSSAFSLWATLSVLFLIFLVHHLWCYDRFQCLRWSAGRQPGAFKRIMTYSYLGAVPLLMVYSIGMTVIKVEEGYILAPDGKFVPTPISGYRDANRSWVLPLQFVFSFAWALEMVTHLEELAFWLYLLHQNQEKEAWFSSWEYRLWYMGSVSAIIGMPLTALITRKTLETCDAYIILVGASGSTATTLAFLHVLWRFPKFIRHVKTDGADPAVVVRLATFYQLNQVRVVFRFLFTIPLLILALDGIIGTRHSINQNLFATDFLQILAGIGCFVSSMFTLLIFFPRSIVRESGYKPKVPSTIAHSPKSPSVSPPSHSGPFPYDVPANIRLQHIPPHMVGYASPSALGMSATGGTRYSMAGYTTTGYTESAYTHSVYSPRESLYDSPQYVQYPPSSGEEGTDMQRRGSRVSRTSRRLASRRASAYSVRPMDAHPEGGSDGEYEGDDERRRDGERGRVREDEESAPPYSHSHPPLQPHPRPHGQPDQQTEAQAHLHQRQPFLRSDSNIHIPSSPAAAAAAPDPGFPPPLNPPSSPPPAPAYPLNIHAVPADSSNSPPLPTSRGKRRTWDWEERRLAPPQAHGRRGSLHLITNGPGATAVNLGPGGAGVGLGLGVSLNLNLTTGSGGGSGGGNGRRRSALHPYVVNFTSPIDLVDLPPARDELPRAI